MNKKYVYLLPVVAALAFYYVTQGIQRERVAEVWSFSADSADEPISPLPQKMNLDPGKVELGRRLFDEKRLSRDNTISCASCHDLARGGVDGLPHSIGINGTEGPINAPTVLNSAFNFRQFWDGRAATLEDQVDGPVQHPGEMGMDWTQVVAKLEQDERYRRDFSALYTGGITREAIKNAIATFERSLVTPDGKFDRYLRGEKNALNQDELEGYQLFKDLGCVSCHQGMNVGGNMYEKLGLIENYFEKRGNIQPVDLGRYNLTKKEEHRYEFRVPSLRNVELTAPYFHDASAKTLEQAVSIMARYQLGIQLPDEKIDRIVSFLKTLTGKQPVTGEGSP